jgi:hypothetical protein
MSPVYFNNNTTQPIENLVSIFKEFVLTYNLSPEFSEKDIQVLKQALIETEGFDEEVLSVLFGLN